MRWQSLENGWYSHVSVLMVVLMMLLLSVSAKTVELYMILILASLDNSHYPIRINRPSHVQPVSSDNIPFQIKKTYVQISLFLLSFDINLAFYIFLILSINYEYRNHTKISLKKYHRRTKRDFLFSRNKTYILSTRDTRKVPYSWTG